MQGQCPLQFWAGGPSRVALDVVPLRGKMSIGSGEACHCLDLGEGSGTGEEGAIGADICSDKEAPCERLKGWAINECPSNMR